MIPCGTRDKLTRKINVRSRFVSSPSPAGELAPVSLVLYCASYPPIWHLESRTSSKRVKQSERGRGKPRCSARRNFLRRVREMQPTRFDYPNPDWSSGSRFLGASRASRFRPWIRPAHLAGRSEIKRISPPVALQPLGTALQLRRSCQTHTIEIAVSENVLKRETRAILVQARVLREK